MHLRNASLFMIRGGKIVFYSVVRAPYCCLLNSLEFERVKEGILEK